MERSRYFILKNCKTGDIITATLGFGPKGALSETKEVVAEAKEAAPIDSGPGIESLVAIVYYASTDEVVGCFSLIGQSEEGSDDYYIDSKTHPLRTCSECAYQLNFINMQNDVVKTFDGSASVVKSIAGFDEKKS